MRSASSSKPARLPRNWPDGVEYTPRPLGLDNLKQSQVCQPLPSVSGTGPGHLVVDTPAEPVSHVSIQSITDPKHPACGQHGLFALKNLPPNSFILLYCGDMHGPDDPREDSDYDLSLDRESGIGIDAAKIGNEARFTNDYRGVRDRGPNAEFRDAWIDLGTGQAMKGIAIFVLSAGKGKDPARVKGIRKGDEILVSYGKGFWDHRKVSAE